MLRFLALLLMSGISISANALKCDDTYTSIRHEFFSAKIQKDGVVCLYKGPCAAYSCDWKSYKISGSFIPSDGNWIADPKTNEKNCVKYYDQSNQCVFSEI